MFLFGGERKFAIELLLLFALTNFAFFQLIRSHTTKFVSSYTIALPRFMTSDRLTIDSLCIWVKPTSGTLLNYTGDTR